MTPCIDPWEAATAEQRHRMRYYCTRCKCHHSDAEGHLKRYTIRTRYHVWSIIDRETDRAVEHIGARGRGDEAARKLARETCDRLNTQYEDGIIMTGERFMTERGMD